MSNITTALQAVNEAVERIKNDETQYFPEAASVGDAVRQGDIYIQKIDDFTEVPAFYHLAPVPNPQLAPGESKGSRHILSSLDGVEIFELDPATASWSGVFEHPAIAALGTTNLRWRAMQNEGGRLLEALAYRGPILRVSKSVTVTHPEHGDWVLPCGTYQITFQRTVDSAKQVARVID